MLHFGTQCGLKIKYFIYSILTTADVTFDTQRGLTPFQCVQNIDLLSLVITTNLELYFTASHHAKKVPTQHLALNSLFKNFFMFLLALRFEIIEIY